MSQPDTESGLSATFAGFLKNILRWPVRILLTGFVIILPFVLLGFLYGMALDFVRGLLEPIIAFLRWGGFIRMANFGFLGRFLIQLGFYDDIFGFFVEFLAVLVLLGTVITLGIIASFRSGKRMLDYIDVAIMSIPGIGPLYKSFRRMGDVVLESGLDRFQSVKLVEFPNDDNYALAFETNRAPESVKAVTKTDDLVTLFVPLAPNPVMGGFLIHVSRSKVYDIDMTVEQAARALITSGIAAGDEEQETPSMNPFQRVKRIQETDKLTNITPFDIEPDEIEFESGKSTDESPQEHDEK